MYKGKTILGLIPARGGSKGLPGKNIKRFIDKPLIAWAIEGARKSKYIDKVIVSTDDKKIATVSRRFSAETPFLRKKRLATSRTTAIDVVLDAIRRVERQGGRYDLVILLQPTSPLRTTEDIDEAIELLFRKKAKAVVSLCRSEHLPQWSNTVDKSGWLDGFITRSKMHKVRQEFPEYYRQNGAIYLTYCDHLKAHKAFFGKDSYGYIMPQERSVDIDTEMDFAIGEYLYKKLRKRQVRLKKA